jgi:glycosyltransferase involved in cell wall biosynthesis
MLYMVVPMLGHSMKIYFITSKLNFRSAGGSVEEIDYVIRILREAGHEMTVITASSSQNNISEPLPYTLIEEQLHSKRQLSMQRAIYRLLHKYEYDADFFIIDAHLFMYGAGLYRLLGGKTPVAAFVNQFLTCWPQYYSSYFPQKEQTVLGRFKKSIRWYLEKYIGMHLANRVDLYAFVSPTLRKMYEDFGIRHSDRDIIIGDPINIKALMEISGMTEMSYRNRLKREGPLMLFFSSRMSPGKGFDMFLQGFARVKNKDNYKVILGGTGPEEKQVHQMVKDLKLEKYVTLPGWVDKEQLYDYYRQADIFIQADWWPAGTSISLLYALAFGVPSILPGGGGLQWNAGEGAVYFPYHDPDLLARRIEELSGNPDLRAKLSAGCYERLGRDDVNYPALIKEFAGRMEKISGLNSR